MTARPANLSWEEASAIPYGGLLALHFLRRANVHHGQRVLIYGASGAVGTSAVQLARHYGAQVTAVCSGANTGLVTSLGASAVVDYTQEDFTTRTERYDLIFDAVGQRKSARAFRQSRRVLTGGGACLSVDDGTPRLQVADLGLLKELAEAGEIRPVIDRVYPLEQIAEAHRYVDRGHKKGNVIITVGREMGAPDIHALALVRGPVARSSAQQERHTTLNNCGTRRNHRRRARGQVRGQSANRSRSPATSCGLSPKGSNAVSGIWSSCEAT
jgi:NADPH:quinone reductase-like Zn-dependent oxidoreductase